MRTDHIRLLLVTLICTLPGAVLSTAEAQTGDVYRTVYTDHQPPLTTATYDAAKGDLTVTVDLNPAPPATGSYRRAEQGGIAGRKPGSRPQGFARLEFYGRNGQVFDAPANDLFDELKGKPHAQQEFVRGTATFHLHLSPGAISREKRLVVVISYTQGSNVLGPGFTTVILTPSGSARASGSTARGVIAATAKAGR